MRLNRRWQTALLTMWVAMLVIAYFFRHDKHINYPVVVQVLEVLGILGIPVTMVALAIRWRFSPVVSMVASSVVLVVACWDVRPHEAGVFELIVFGLIWLTSAAAAIRGLEPTPGRVGPRLPSSQERSTIW